MNNKQKIFLTLIIALIILSLFGHKVVDARNEIQNPSGSVCSKNTNAQRGTVLEYAWFSSTKTGNWETDQLFYKLNGYEDIIVLQYDGIGYYLVCWDFGSDLGYDPIVGWVQKDRIILDSQVTPIP